MMSAAIRNGARCGFMHLNALFCNPYKPRSRQWTLFLWGHFEALIADGSLPGPNPISL